jgi:hypothetical protein
VGVHPIFHLCCQQHLMFLRTMDVFCLTGRCQPQTDQTNFPTGHHLHTCPTHRTGLGWTYHSRLLQRGLNQCQLLHTNPLFNCVRSQVITHSFPKELAAFLFDSNAELNPPIVHLPCFPPLLLPLSPPILRSTGSRLLGFAQCQQLNSRTDDFHKIQPSR